MKACDLKELRPNKTRVFIEHGLTLAIWSFWFVSLVTTIENWHWVIQWWAGYSPTAKIEMLAAAAVFVALCMSWKCNLGSKKVKFGAPKLDPSAKTKCLELFGWSEEDLKLAQNSRLFDLHGPSDSMASLIRVPQPSAIVREAEEIAAQHG